MQIYTLSPNLLFIHTHMELEYITYILIPPVTSGLYTSFSFEYFTLLTFPLLFPTCRE